MQVSVMSPISTSIGRLFELLGWFCEKCTRRKPTCDRGAD